VGSAPSGKRLPADLYLHRFALEPVIFQSNHYPQRDQIDAALVLVCALTVFGSGNRMCDIEQTLEPQSLQKRIST
jgi:hypothetical protein